MEPLRKVTGVAVPLRRSEVDTDQIIPAVFLKRVTKTGFDDALFHAWRQDPGFVLNDPRYEGAKVLVAGPDFGTGSSREHAVWALRDYGFRVVLAPRFGDIFRNNAGKQGLLAGVITEAETDAIQSALEAAPGTAMSVDLETRTWSVDGGASGSFEIDDYTGWRLLEGLDDIALTLRHAESITRFEAGRPRWMPRTL